MNMQSEKIEAGLRSDGPWSVSQNLPVTLAPEVLPVGGTTRKAQRNTCKLAS